MNSNKILDGPLCTPMEIMESRELRVERQKDAMITGASLITFSLNIPGAVKAFPLAEACFHEGLQVIKDYFSDSILKVIQYSSKTGSEAIICVNLDAITVKRATVSIEESHPLGRLFDIDVKDDEEKSLSRADLDLPPRKCLLCNQTAKICARSQAHPIELLQAHIKELLNMYFKI